MKKIAMILAIMMIVFSTESFSQSLSKNVGSIREGYSKLTYVNNVPEKGFYLSWYVLHCSTKNMEETLILGSKKESLEFINYMTYEYKSYVRGLKKYPNIVFETKCEHFKNYSISYYLIEKKPVISIHSFDGDHEIVMTIKELKKIKAMIRNCSDCQE